MAVSVDIKDNSSNVKTAIKQACQAGLEAIGIQAENHAMRFIEGDGAHPRRINTSNLRDSITHKVKGNEEAVYIGTDVEYAPYVHFGTSKMLPNYFLRDAAANYMSEYVDILKEHLNAIK